MALKGTLSDLGIVDLLQFPHAGRKTGRLVVEHGEKQAVLFYEDGAMVHAILGQEQGFEAVVRVLDWKEGTFSFDNEGPAPDRTIQDDLHRLMMKALKVRDERAEERKRQQQEQERLAREKALRDQGIDPVLMKVLEEQFPSHALTFVAVLSSKGDRLASASEQQDPIEAIDEIVEVLHALRVELPRPGLKKVVLQDEEGTIVLHMLSGGKALLAIGRADVPVGAVSMAATKAAGAVEGAMG